MSKGLLRLLALVVVSTGVGAAWEVASPWWTLWNMRDAAEARDSERLASYVDFPRLRSNLREQLVGLAAKKGPMPAYEAFIRRASASVLIDPVVNAIVSSKALRLAFLVRRERDPKIPAANRKCGMRRESLERFRLRCARLSKARVDLIFEREGLGWRLVGMDLPDDYRAIVS
jgi:hypothetical protein